MRPMLFTAAERFAFIQEARAATERATALRAWSSAMRPSLLIHRAPDRLPKRPR